MTDNEAIITLRIHLNHPFDWLRRSHARTPDEAADFIDVEADARTGAIRRVTHTQPLQAVTEHHTGHWSKFNRPVNPTSLLFDADTEVGVADEVVRTLSALLRANGPRVEWLPSRSELPFPRRDWFFEDVFTELDAATRHCGGQCHTLVDEDGRFLAFAPRGSVRTVSLAPRLWARHLPLLRGPHSGLGERPVVKLLDGSRPVLWLTLDVCWDALTAVRSDGEDVPDVLARRLWDAEEAEAEAWRADQEAWFDGFGETRLESLLLLQAEFDGRAAA